MKYRSLDNVLPSVQAPTIPDPAPVAAAVDVKTGLDEEERKAKLVVDLGE